MWGAYGYFQHKEIKLLNSKFQIPRVTSKSFFSNKFSIENRNYSNDNKSTNNDSNSNYQVKTKKDVKDKEREREKDNDKNRNDDDWRAGPRSSQIETLVLKQKKTKHSLSGDDVRNALRTIKEENKLESLQRGDGRFLFTSPFLLSVMKKLIEDIGLGGQVNESSFLYYIIIIIIIMSVCLCFSFLFACFCVNLFVFFLFICLFIYLFVHLFIYLFIYFFLSFFIHLVFLYFFSYVISSSIIFFS